MYIIKIKVLKLIASELLTIENGVFRRAKFYTILHN